MANFIRRFRFDPGIETLIAIESINILDLEPPAAITGVSTGTAMVVGEFENGPFATPTEVTGSTDLKNQFGTFGYEYDGSPGSNPSARARTADSALVPEFWNGNGFISLANKRFSRLVIVRVDTSVGEVEFSRLACLSGSTAPVFDLEPGQILELDDGGGPTAATFTAAVATVSSGAGTYPSTFTGGEQMVVRIDGSSTANPSKTIGPITITFQAADQSQAQVIARINQALGYTAAIDAGGGVTDLSGRIRGTDGEVNIISIDASVATATGFVVGITAGTGNVGDIDEVTVAEVDAVVNAALASVNADRDADGALRVCETATPLTGTLEVTAGTTAAGLGFTVGQAADAAVGVDGTIPAGTRVRNGSAVEWVTMQDLSVAAANAGPYSVKVRPALDDGSVLGSVPGSVTVVPFPIRLGGFAVTNPLALTAALSEAAIDAQYLAAIDSTLQLNSVAAEANFIWSSRQSNAIRNALITNAITASQQGALGRMAFVRPPLGTTTRAIAQGNTVPGVGVNRDRRRVYAYPGVQTYISQIAFRGSAFGDGFTDDGVIDAGFDGFIVSVCSNLPPEENPGQLTEFLFGVLGIEANNPDVQNLTIVDYTNFRANGIAAPLIDDGTPIIQSGVTSVDPSIFPQLRNIARQRMSDFIGDSLARRAKSFGKKAQTRSRRAALISEQRAFLRTLLDDERIESFSVDGGSGNSPETLSLGIFRSIIKARTLPSFDSIVLEQTVGETVTVDDIT